MAEIEYAEWTGGTNEGSGPKLRAPVFLGLRDDKEPKSACWKTLAPSFTFLSYEALLHIFHRQQRAIVAGAGIDRTGDDAGEGVPQLRILGDQAL